MKAKFRRNFGKIVVVINTPDIVVSMENTTVCKCILST